MATDSRGRRVDYLRISLTDRCNLRCSYCMPPEGVAWKPHEEILTYEEIERFAVIAAEEGISKVRLTGGEPLVRKGVVGHVGRMAGIVGARALALTTNGTLLPGLAGRLADAGLTRVNVSLDTLDPERYRSITGGGDLSRALAGIDAAFEAGMETVKINVVVVRRFEQDLPAFARMTLERPLHVRFIEYMPVGGGSASLGSGDPSAGAWSRDDSVPGDEVLKRLAREGERAGLGELEAVGREEAPGGWGPARYYRFPGATGTVGIISPLSHHFCAECNRLRLTADGRLRACLFSDDELDVRRAVRTGSDDDVRTLIRAALDAKPEGHAMRVGTARNMSQIGG